MSYIVSCNPGEHPKDMKLERICDDSIHTNEIEEYSTFDPETPRAAPCELSQIVYSQVMFSLKRLFGRLE